MKKVRIMLVIMIVLTTLGGELAFKAKAYTENCYYSDVVSHTREDCPLRGTGFKTIPGPGVFYVTTAFKVGGLCPFESCTLKYATIPE